MLATRLATSVILVAVFVAVLWLDERLGPWYPGWFVLALLGMSLTAREVADLLSRTSARPSTNTVVGGVVALVLANWAPHVIDAWIASSWYRETLVDLTGAIYEPSAPINWLAWPLWTFVAVVMYAFIAQSAQFEKPGGTMATISGTVLAVAYVGLLGSFVLQMRWLGSSSEGLVALVTLFATAKGADIGAYTTGRIAGRHKLWPRLSPNKTIEGAAGGLIFGLLAAVLVTSIAEALFGVPTLSWPAALGFGLVVGAAAQLGDLMESMIKRDCAQKDSSAAIPGFGGILDVVDSLLFAGPVAYGFWLLARP